MDAGIRTYLPTHLPRSTHRSSMQRAQQIAFDGFDPDGVGMRVQGARCKVGGLADWRNRSQIPFVSRCEVV